jgi:hypothetical protein
MAAFVILSIGVLGVAAGLLTAMRISTKSREATEATYLAEQQMEIFKIMTGPDLIELAETSAGDIEDGFGGEGEQAEAVEGGGGYGEYTDDTEYRDGAIVVRESDPIDPDPDDGIHDAFYRVWAVEEDRPEVGVMTITVTVSWIDQKGKTRKSQITTIKANS